MEVGSFYNHGRFFGMKYRTAVDLQVSSIVTVTENTEPFGVNNRAILKFTAAIAQTHQSCGISNIEGGAACNIQAAGLIKGIIVKGDIICDTEKTVAIITGDFDERVIDIHSVNTGTINREGSPSVADNMAVIHGKLAFFS